HVREPPPALPGPDASAVGERRDPDRNRTTAGARLSLPGRRFGEASPASDEGPADPLAIARMQLVAADPSSPPAREEPPPLCGVYRLGERLDERAGVERFAARRAHGGQSPVVLLREAVPTAGVNPAATWPGAAWELELRERLRGPAVAPVVDQFEENGFRYLVLDSGPGVTLWNAWDDPKHGPFEQYAWLAQLAEVLDALHQVGVVLESLRPDQVVLDAFGRLLLDPTVMLLP